MHLQVVYCNHQTADLSVRERLAFSDDSQLVRAYDVLRARFPDSEAVVISTCNRIEVYTAQETAAGPALREIVEFFADFHSQPAEVFADDLLRREGSQAVQHLFQVACSLDSMVLGEPQIVNQVKQAYQLAQQTDACGPLTCALFEGAIRVSKRVRTETGLERGRVSIASVAVGDFGKSIFDRFEDKLVLIIGAGEMAEETLRYLQDEGVRDVVVVNRSGERALRLAEEFGGVARPYDELAIWLAKADVIVSTTGASVPIVEAETFAKIREQTARDPVFILDLGAPRDFAPDVRDVDDNVFLYDIGDLEATCERNRNQRKKEIARAMAIVEEETEKFMHEVYHRATGPIVKRLREEWHSIRQSELELLFSKCDHLSTSDQQAIEKSVERIINKLLHPPLTVLRSEAKDGTPHGLLNAMKRLFSLGE